MRLITENSGPSNIATFRAASVGEAVRKASDAMTRPTEAGAVPIQGAVWLRDEEPPMANTAELVEHINPDVNYGPQVDGDLSFKVSFFETYPGVLGVETDRFEYSGSNISGVEQNPFYKNGRGATYLSLRDVFGSVNLRTKVARKPVSEPHMDNVSSNGPPEGESSLLFQGYHVRVVSVENNARGDEIGSYVYDPVDLARCTPYEDLLQAVEQDEDSPQNLFVRYVRHYQRGNFPDPWEVSVGDWLFASNYLWPFPKALVHAAPRIERDCYQEGRVVNIFDCTNPVPCV